MSFTTGKDLATKFGYRTGLGHEKMAVLRAAWDKEMGHFGRFYELKGIKKSSVFVQAKTPAAAQELTMRAPELVRNLNKYFQRGWIKAIKLSR